MAHTSKVTSILTTCLDGQTIIRFERAKVHIDRNTVGYIIDEREYKADSAKRVEWMQAYASRIQQAQAQPGYQPYNALASRIETYIGTFYLTVRYITQQTSDNLKQIRYTVRQIADLLHLDIA